MDMIFIRMLKKNSSMLLKLESPQRPIGIIWQLFFSKKESNHKKIPRRYRRSTEQLKSNLRKTFSNWSIWYYLWWEITNKQEKYKRSI